MAGKIAPYIFTVVIPLVVAAMIPHLGPEIGLPIILISVVIGLTDFSWLYSSKHHTRVQVIPIAVMAVGALILGSGAIWFALAPGVVSIAAPNAPKPRKQEPLAPAQTLFAECRLSLPPTTMPASGRLYVLQAWPVPIENGGGGLGEQFGIPGSEIVWPKLELGVVEAIQCQITNYGDTPAFNVKMVLGLEFVEAIKQGPNGFKGGATKLARDWPILISKIDPGAANPFVFYVLNFTEYFFSLTIPDSALVELPGEVATSLKITKPPSTIMFLSPSREPKNPSDSAPQTSKPQDMPERK